jgi:hypothetical protein
MLETGTCTCAFGHNETAEPKWYYAGLGHNEVDNQIDTLLGVSVWKVSVRGDVLVDSWLAPPYCWQLAPRPDQARPITC